MDAARGCGLSLLLAALVLACSSGPKAPTQLVVNADADAEVATRIRRVRALLYDTQETDVEKPSHQQAFTVVSGEPTEDQVKLPFSFGVVAGRANRAVLVIRGYTTLAANARPAIEHKQIVEFKTGKSIRVPVELAEICLNRGTQCGGLDVTCAAEVKGSAQPGACAPLHDNTSDAGSGAGADAGSDTADGATDSGVDAELPPIVPLETCPFDSECTADYPCVESQSFALHVRRSELRERVRRVCSRERARAAQDANAPRESLECVRPYALGIAGRYSSTARARTWREFWLS